MLAVIVSVALVLAATTVDDESRTDESAARRRVERIDAVVASFAARGFRGSVLVARDGAVIAECAAGNADLEESVPNTAETLFEIASLTKQFTAAAILLLARDGALALDDPISKHLPGVPENCRAITIEHLLRHTSGIPGTNSSGAGDDVVAVMPSFLAGGPRHAPGAHFEYWNQGYALLSEIIKRRSGMEYADFCRKRLFAPAGMRASRFTGDAAPEGASVAVGRSSRGAPRSALEHPYGAYGLQYRGMGGAVCSVRDLWKWDRVLDADAVLDAPARARMLAPGPGDYSLGWFVRRDAQGRRVQSHGGGVRGFACEMRRYPDQDAAIIVLANDDAAPVRALTDALARALFDEPAKPEERMRPLDAGKAAAIAGSFQSERGNIVEIESADGRARGRIRWSPPNGPITHFVLLVDESATVHLFDGSDAHALEVERNAEDRVTAVTILRERYRRVASPK